MKKIIVIGCPGAGKSTFSRALADVTGIELYHLDLIWHKPDRTNIPRDEFDAKLNDIMVKESWIIDGNYGRTLEMRLKKCDTVFFLDFPLEVCLVGAMSRVGKKRDDMPWIEEEFNDDFKQWIMDFPEKQLPMIHDLLDKYGENKNVVVLKSRQQAESCLNQIRQTFGT